MKLLVIAILCKPRDLTLAILLGPTERAVYEVWYNFSYFGGGGGGKCSCEMTRKPHDLTLSMALISAPLSSRATMVSVWPFFDDM